MPVRDAAANLCLQHRFGADLALPWMSLAGTPCTLIKACLDGAVVPEGLRRWHTGSTSYKRPRCKLQRQTQLGHRNSSLSGNFSINSISIFNINSSSWRRRQRILGKCFPRTTDPVGTSGVWTRDGSDWCVIARPNTTSESESMNHRQDWCVNARSNDEVQDEPVLTASHFFRGTPIWD